MKKKLLELKLTKLQSKHYPSILWLIGGYGKYGEGRSYLMAICYIQKALHTRNWVIVRDHNCNREADKFLMSVILYILKDNKMKYAFRVLDNSFMVVL